MEWRHELKYLIDEATFHELYFSLRPVMHGDRHANTGSLDGLRSYHIRSLYFDDAGSRGIFEKLAGVDHRHKFRIRIYNDSDLVIHLEKKSKQNNLSSKQTCRLTRAQVDALLDGDPGVLLEDRSAPTFRAPAESSASSVADRRGWQREMVLLNQFYAEIRTRLLAPRLLVDYERLPLTWPDGNVRVTFDRNLATGHFRQDLWDPAAGLQPVLEPGTMVMEVKYDHFLPEFISTMLSIAGACPISISKYAQCAGFIRTHSWEDQN
jgi:hypothetical protein